MGRLGDKLRSVGSQPGHSKGIMHWCPGCESSHVIWYSRPPDSGAPVWYWDGNIDAPTCAPSVRWFVNENGADRTICHYFLESGKIRFCSDSAHKFAGQDVPLPDWPYADGEYGGD